MRIFARSELVGTTATVGGLVLSVGALATSLTTVAHMLRPTLVGIFGEWPSETTTVVTCAIAAVAGIVSMAWGLTHLNNLEEDAGLPASIRLPAASAIFLAGFAITVSIAFQPDNEPDLLAGFVRTFGNLLRGLLLGLPFTLTAMTFNVIFKPKRRRGAADPGHRSASA